MIIKINEVERVCYIEESDIKILKDLIKLSNDKDNDRIFKILENLNTLDLLYVILINDYEAFGIRIDRISKYQWIEELSKDNKHLIWKKFSEFLYYLKVTDNVYPSYYFEFLNRFVVIDETTSYLKIRGRESIYNEYPVDKLNPINGYIHT